MRGRLGKQQTEVLSVVVEYRNYIIKDTRWPKLCFG